MTQGSTSRGPRETEKGFVTQGSTSQVPRETEKGFVTQGSMSRGPCETEKGCVTEWSVSRGPCNLEKGFATQGRRISRGPSRRSITCLQLIALVTFHPNSYQACLGTSGSISGLVLCSTSQSRIKRCVRFKSMRQTKASPTHASHLTKITTNKQL